MADGSSLALEIKVFVSGTLGLQRSNVSSRMLLIRTCYRSILVQQAFILPREEMMVWSEFGGTLGGAEHISRDVGSGPNTSFPCFPVLKSIPTMYFPRC